MATSAPARGLLRILAAAGLAVGSVVGVAGAASAQEAEEPEISHAAEECIHLLEEGGNEPEDCHEAPSPILPEASEVVWGSISFFALLFLMWKFAYPGIKKGMDGRTNRIRENLDDAERVKAEAQSVLEEYQRQLADARNEANRIIEDARQTAEQLRRDLMQRAEAEVAELRQRSRDDIAAAMHRASADLQGRVGAMAIELAEKVVEANLDRDANMRLIDGFIASVGAGGNGK
ncbi:MAG TPA: F0F1 ATP synthase subunit B [Acidimicrobiales bacterium]|nr:F0F1 ATP synthase subunit B [Acidimicrobiales bacterium]